MGNREQLRLLLEEYQLTQAKAAELLCYQTQRPCSVRTVRSWLNDPDKVSSRPCPEWAIVALRAAIQKNSL